MQSVDVNRTYAALATILAVVAVVTYVMDAGIVDRILRLFSR